MKRMFKSKSLRNLFTSRSSNRWLYMTLLSGTVYSAANIAIRWFCGRLGDRILANTLSFGFLLAFLLTTLLYFAFQALTRRGSCRYDGALLCDLYDRLERKLLTGEQRTIDSWDTGSLSTLFMKDTETVAGFMNRFLSKAVPDAVCFLVSLLVLCTIHFSLPIVACLCGTIPILISKVLNSSMRKSYQLYQEALDDVNGRLQSNLSHLEMMKVNLLEDYYSKKDEENLEKLHRAKQKSARAVSLFSAPATFSSFITMVVLAGCGGYLCVTGHISIGSLLTVLTLSDGIVSPIMGLDRTLTMYHQMDVCFQRIQRFADVAEEASGSFVPREGDGTEILVDGISFGYSQGQKLLENLSMKVEKGQLCFILGENGTGKSTLIKLLMGIYPPDAGRVSVGGVAAGAWKKERLRGLFSIASQEPLLFAMSIRDNLTLGSDRISEERMEQVSKLIGIHDEIVQLEKSYDTLLSDNGKPLSKGQRQRLTLVRAILRDTDILIFDEPTSALDAGHAAQFMDYVRELSKNKIILMITHDLSLIRNEDRIFRLQKLQELQAKEMKSV